MDKNKILNYVMHTPGNTNPNVLGSMLEGMGGNNLLIVNATTTDFSTVTEIDKTFDEIVDFALKGGAVVMRLVSDSPGAPYVTAFYLTLNSVNSDYSPSVGGGLLNFYSINASVTDYAEISLDVYTVIMQTNGNATLKHAHKLLSLLEDK